MLNRITTILLITLAFSEMVSGQETIFFPSLDTVEISADVYIKHDETAPFIVLFHQATYSRGEYIEIAPKLNKLGYNCMAVDLRSGYAANEIPNITQQNARKAQKSYRFVDTYQDIIAAVNYAQKNFAKGKLIIWGSSYSSSLVIKYAGEHQNIDAVLSFSPGEYFKNEGKPADFIAQSAANVNVPVFITSKQSEKSNWEAIYKAILHEGKTYFLPDFVGKHGSAALWEKSEGHLKYWEQVLSFLESL